MSIITIVIGVIIWWVVPILTNDAIKKKAHKKAVVMLCRIIGITIIALAVINYLVFIVLN